MSTVADKCAAFSSENEIDVEILLNFVTELFQGLVVGSVTRSGSTTSSPKQKKNFGVEDINADVTAEQLDKGCTVVVLKQFCKNNSLIQSGTKPQIIERIITFFSGEISEKELTPSARTKVTKSKKENYQCCCTTRGGTPCQKSATYQDTEDKKWYCATHWNM